MSLPFSDQEVTWRLAVNGNYWDAMRTLMNLVTASLVLPLFLVRNFLGVPEGQPITNYLRRSAYWSWGSLFLSLLCGMGFFFASAKYVKLVYTTSGESWTWQTWEELRDGSGIVSVVSFLAGLCFLLWYFAHDIRKKV
jgi:hypothetical protein